MKPSTRMAAIQEGYGSISVTIPKPSLQHLDRFISLKCASDLIALGIFPNAKEITESMAALAAVKKIISGGVRRFGDTGVTFIDVGSGHKGRTGTLFAYLTKWDCHSIDPLLNQGLPLSETPTKRIDGRVIRWTGWQLKVEELVKTFEADTIVMAGVHNHAPLQVIWDKCKAREKYCISIPCCFPQEIRSDTGATLQSTYEDWGIHSEHRLVKIWDNLKTLDI